MDCVTLETLMVNHEPVNLIDIRAKNEFREMHIPGARSLPFAELASPKGFPRYRRTAEHVYIVSDDQGRSSLASGILRASGYMNAMVVDGGMKAWIGQGLPVSRNFISPRLPNLLSAIAALLATLGIAFAVAKILVAAIILILFGAAALLLKVTLFAGASATQLRTGNMSKVEPKRWRGIDVTITRPVHAY